MFWLQHWLGINTVLHTESNDWTISPWRYDDGWLKRLFRSLLSKSMLVWLLGFYGMRRNILVNKLCTVFTFFDINSSKDKRQFARFSAKYFRACTVRCWRVDQVTVTSK